MRRPPHTKLTPDGRHVLRRKHVRAYWTLFTDELKFTPEQTAEFLLDHALPDDIRAAQQHESKKPDDRTP